MSVNIGAWIDASIPLLTSEQEIALGKRISEGDESAITELAAANVRLVMKTASYFSMRYKYPLDDLIQVGQIGVIIAAQRFDYTTGNKFSTYATHWIRQTIWRHVQDHRYLISLPIHVQEDITKVKRATANYVVEHGRNPNTQELADITKITEHRVKIAMRYQDTTCVSLDLLLTDDWDSDTLADVFADTSPTFNPESQLANSVEQAKVQRLLAILKPRERRVIEMRYGLGSYHRPHTFAEMAVPFKITGERIRMIEKIAMNKMRHAALQQEEKGA